MKLACFNIITPSSYNQATHLIVPIHSRPYNSDWPDFMSSGMFF